MKKKPFKPYLAKSPMEDIQCYYCNQPMILSPELKRKPKALEKFDIHCHNCNIRYVIAFGWNKSIPQVNKHDWYVQFYEIFLDNKNLIMEAYLDDKEAMLFMKHPALAARDFSSNPLITFKLNQIIYLSLNQLNNKINKLLPFI
jgi:hypothetical protein